MKALQRMTKRMSWPLAAGTWTSLVLTLGLAGCEMGPPEAFVADDESPIEEEAADPASGEAWDRAHAELGYATYGTPAAPTVLSPVDGSSPPVPVWSPEESSQTPAGSEPASAPAGDDYHGDPHPWDRIVPAHGDPHPWAEENAEE